MNMKHENSEKKNVKTLKGQLFGAVSMMLVACIALGTSTYAWFINNQSVDIDSMQMQVSTSTSLMVALGKDGTTADGKVEAWTGYKTKIINDDITGLNGVVDGADWATMLTNPLAPASIADASLANASGQTSLTVAPAFFKSTDVVVNGKLTDFAALTVGTTAGDIGAGVVKRIPLRFLSSKDLNVYFGSTAETLVTAAAANITKMLGEPLADIGTIGQPGFVSKADQVKGVRAALRLAVVPHSTTGQTVSTPLVFQFDAGADAFAGSSTVNTDWNGKTVTPAVNEAAGNYWGITAVDNGKIDTLGALTAKTPTAGNPFVAVWDTSNTKFITSGTAPLFALTGNEPRDVDIYIWLDGTDKDCVSNLSEYGFTLNMPFAAVPPAAVPVP